MELLFLIFCVLLFPALYVAKAIKPYADGTKQIDHLKYPTLARAQRIRRYKNVKAREIEFNRKNAEFSKKTLAIEAATENQIAQTRSESKVDAEFNEWDVQFSDITRERDEAIRKEAARVAAIERAKQAAIAAEIREKELAIWTAQEKVRIQQFMADQKAAQALEQQQAAELLRSRENDVQALRKYYVPDSNNKSFGYRIVSVHGLYVRKLPVKASRMVDNLTTGAMVSVNGWITGDELYGNPIWFKLANGAGWIWSGGVDNTSTSGLMNYNYMNEPGDSFTQKNAYGEIIMQHTTPSEMQDLIDTEIRFLEAEKAQLAQKALGDNPWGKINATMITADRIYVGDRLGSSGATLDRNGMSVTRNGQTVAKFDGLESLQKKVNAGALTSPKEDRYQLFSDGGVAQSYQPSGHVDFWRGTEFEAQKG